MPAEMERIRKALVRDNPNMPVNQSYAMATAAYMKKLRRGGYGYNGSSNDLHNESTDNTELRNPTSETESSN